MQQQRRVKQLVVLASLLILSLTIPSFAVQKEKKKQKTVDATPVLWQEPTDIASRNLLLGPGGETMRPDLRRITFIKEESGGYSKKYRVRDASGREWVAKIGKEAQSETAASRLVWAAGYHTEVTYLVPQVEIRGKGSFENVRFEARPKNFERLGEWKWDDNPFSGTRELQGLKVLMSLIENWDLKDANNRMLLVRSSRGNELRYIISDLGATFGKTDAPDSPMTWLRNIRGSRNEPEDYVSDRFISGIEGNFVRLHYSGKNGDMMNNITIAEAEWLGTWLSRLSDTQIQDAFRAANYTPDEVQILADAVRRRINRLTSLQASAAGTR